MMDDHAYFLDSEVKEAYGRASREAEQWRLSRLAKAQNDGHQGRPHPHVAPIQGVNGGEHAD